MRKKSRNDRAREDPEEADKTARRIVKIAKLDDEDFERTPNDFEECVEFVKDKCLLADPSEIDRELDDLIFRRGVKKLMDEYGLDESEVQIKLKEVVDWEEAG